MHQHRTLRPDNKGRISLGRLSEGISGFKVTIDEGHRIILEPLVEIPAREKWLFDNRKALRQIQQGIEEAAQGKVVKQDFSEYLEDDE